MVKIGSVDFADQRVKTAFASIDYDYLILACGARLIVEKEWCSTNSHDRSVTCNSTKSNNYDAVQLLAFAAVLRHDVHGLNPVLTCCRGPRCNVCQWDHCITNSVDTTNRDCA